jgi:hypothetical protein
VVDRLRVSTCGESVSLEVGDTKIDDRILPVPVRGFDYQLQTTNYKLSVRGKQRPHTGRLSSALLSADDSLHVHER